MKNTNENYGTLAKWFHWVTALLILGAYVAVKYRHWFTERSTPENWTALQLHLSIGITVLAVVILRIVWRISQKQPDPEPGSPAAHMAAKLGHWLLYVVLILAPLTGYLGTGVNTDFFFWFEITQIQDTALFSAISQAFDVTFEAFEKPMDFIHKKILGEWLVWLLVLGHAAMALYHHFALKDRTLKKMTNGAP